MTVSLYGHSGYDAPILLLCALCVSRRCLFPIFDGDVLQPQILLQGYGRYTLGICRVERGNAYVRLSITVVFGSVSIPLVVVVCTSCWLRMGRVPEAG